jgi:hypothetical protein
LDETMQNIGLVTGFLWWFQPILPTALAMANGKLQLAPLFRGKHLAQGAVDQCSVHSHMSSVQNPSIIPL